MPILVGFLKRETIEIPPQKHEMVRLPGPDQVRIDGGPHKPAAPVFIPGVVHRIDELVQRQDFFPAIGFHSRKYRHGDLAPAIRCFTHAEFDEPARGLPHNDLRRAHDEFRGAHHDWRRPDHDRVMAFVSPVFVPVPIAFRENAAAGGEQGDNAAKIQDVFHFQSGYAPGRNFAIRCNPALSACPWYPQIVPMPQIYSFGNSSNLMEPD
jgi:hypothetical protein